MAKQLSCPECKSERIWKDGIRYTDNGEVQRYLCRSCGFRFSSTTELDVKVNVSTKPLKTLKPGEKFSETDVFASDFAFKKPIDDFSFQRSKDVGSHGVTVVAKPINTFRDYNSERQVGVNEKKMKNLATVMEKGEAEAGTPETSTQQDVKGKIIEWAWDQKKRGAKENTIKMRCYLLKRLIACGANLNDAESVKEKIALQETWNDSSRVQAVYAYRSFAKYYKIAFEKPGYRQLEHMPFIPMETEIDQLIASCGRKQATFLQILKETGCRAGEALRLKWTDLDFENRTVRINATEKRSNARIINVSTKLVDMLNSLPRNSECIFDVSFTSMSGCFRRQRQRTAKKLQNPRLLQITYHTLRHWKGTTEYHKTKDIMHVKRILGHKNIENTLVYINLENAVFQTTNDDYTVKVAESIEEACKLLEVGFEYVTHIDEKALFRKRK